jgi:hypothetical protein
MIHVIVEYHNESIQYLEVSGHADYDAHGKDIVCAGVSGLLLSNIMYAQKHHLGVFEAIQAEGYMSVNVEEPDERLNHLLGAVVEGATAMQAQYPDYIKIEKR